jgi:hypothetical protein
MTGSAEIGYLLGKARFPYLVLWRIAGYAVKDANVPIWKIPKSPREILARVVKHNRRAAAI